MLSYKTDYDSVIGDLPTVVDTCVDALEASHDPLLRFLHDTPVR